jgi:hypothetical protein
LIAMLSRRKVWRPIIAEIVAVPRELRETGAAVPQRNMLECGAEHRSRREPRIAVIVV